jgi:phage-related baseplate assembly protein
MLKTLVSPTPSRFPVIRPELLPRPDVLEVISSDSIIEDRMARFKQRWSEEDPPNAAAYDVGQLEFDPIKIVTENASYFELLVRDRVNQAARSVMLAFSFGSNLDAIASRYPGGVPRLAGESDDNYRRRIWLSPNILSAHGTTESYAFYALSALGPNVLRDAAAFTTRGTGRVTIPILVNKPLLVLSEQQVLAIVNQQIQTGLVDPLRVSFETDPGDPPLPTADQILQVYRYISANTRKGLTDEILIARPKVVATRIVIQLKTFPGNSVAATLTNVAANLMLMIEAHRWLGYDLTILDIDTVLGNAGGVYNRTILQPTDDVVVGNDGFVRVTGIDLTWLGLGE